MARSENRTRHRRRHGIKCGYAECEARKSEPRGPKGRERGRGSWGGVDKLGGLGDRCKLSQRGPYHVLQGGEPENFEFGAFWDF